MDVLNRLITRSNGISSGKFERLPPTCEISTQNKLLIDEQKQQKGCKIVKLPWKCCKNNFGENANNGSIKNSKKAGKQKTQNNLLNTSASEPHLNLQVLSNNEFLNGLEKQNMDYEEDCGILFDGDRERLCDKNEKCPSPKNEKLPSPIAGALQRVRGRLPGSKKTAGDQSCNNDISHNVIVATSSAPTLLVKQFRKQAKITDMVGGSIKKSGNTNNSVDLTNNSNNSDKNKANGKNKKPKKGSNDAQRLLLFEEGMAMD
ncbi:hypothetical protein ACQ4LE_010435 [Meloidogyne hapla]|uniref:Uncharacterized protein n=1 Tax=Meloidogyne hapla TaxID=6305 RepID=A0A1I8BTS3_MELHA